nr:subtilisin-like protease SBT1.3 [Tanacetum cinerariifolium]
MMYHMVYTRSNSSRPDPGSLCLEGTLDPYVVGGKIVICDRGISPRIQKSQVVKEAGGTCGELDAFVSIPDEGDMAFLRKKVKSGAAVRKLVLPQEAWFTICDENEILQDPLNTFESSNDNTNVVNAPQEPFVFNQDPSEHSSLSPPHIDHHCCYGCGYSLDDIYCQQCTCESCGNGAHYGYNCPPKVLIISNPEQCYTQNVDEFPQTLPSFHPTCYYEDENLFTYDSNLNFVDYSPNPPPQPPTYSYEFCGNDAHYAHDFPPQTFNKGSMIELRETFQAWLQQQEQVVNLDSYTLEPSQCWKIPIYYDDDDGEERPKDSLIMEDEHLDTIPEKKSDEFIKSSVENLVSSPSEAEDIYDGRCDLPLCDDFPKTHLVTFSNPLFGTDNDLTASDDESFFEEDVPIENFKIFSNTTFDLDEEIISTEIDYLLDEFAGELIFLKSIPSEIDEADLDPEEEIRLVEKLLYDNSSPRPPKEFNSENSNAIIESFSPSPILIEDSDSLMEEIGLFLTPNDSMPPGIENDDYDSEGDIRFLKELLSNDSPSLPKNESFLFDVPSSPRPPAKPPDDDGIYFKPDTRLLTAKVVGNISEHYVLIPRLLPTQPTLASNEEKYPHLLSHRGFKAF